MAKIKQTKIVTTSNTGEDTMKLDHPYTAGKKQNGIATLEEFGCSYKTEDTITTQPNNCTLSHLSQKNENLHFTSL